MVNYRTMATAIMAAASAVALCGAALAQTSSTGRAPSQGDFDACNREAQLSAGSASPGGRGSTSGTGASVTGSATGSAGGTGSLSGGSTLSSGSASVTGDMGLRGIAPGQNDPAYQRAYRDCLQRRGF
jgi:hypothetical protein